MNPDCIYYDKDKNYCGYFSKGNVPVAKVCKSCQYRQSVKESADPCAEYRTEDPNWCFNPKIGTFRHRSIKNVCERCKWSDE